MQSEPGDLKNDEHAATPPAVGVVNAGRSPRDGGSEAPVIAVRGARENNLKALDVDIPRGQLTVVTGASGGGKTSLLMGTLFAEGRRRFLRTLPAAARKVVGRIPRPRFDSLTGLPPVVAVSQGLSRASQRSTVATLSELSSVLALLFARAGRAHCPGCGDRLQAQTVDQIARQILARPERTKVVVLAPLVDRSDDEPIEAAADLLQRIEAAGFVRVSVDGDLFEVGDAPPLDDGQPHDVAAVVDRLIVKPGIEERLRESLDLAVEHGEGRCHVQVLGDEPATEMFSVRFACGRCGISYPDPEPRLFRFQSPYGACDRCRGYGLLTDDDKDEQGEPSEPGEDDRQHVSQSHGDSGDERVCPACEGTRLQPFARAVTLAGETYPQVLARCPSEVAAWLAPLAGPSFVADDAIGAAAIELLLPDVLRRCETMDELGLGYLTLDRRGPTLSGGERQRVRLVAALGSGLTSVAYLLDEPTAGLHPSDTRRLLSGLRRLQNDGNTVAVIEHDEDVAAAADWVVEIGPEGGRQGGELVAVGPPPKDDDRAAQTPAAVSPSPPPRPSHLPESLTLSDVRARTLQGFDLSLPAGELIGVCGVSGSGKSTLVHEVIGPAVLAVLDGQPVPPQLAASCDVPASIEAVATVGQDTAGRSTRSTPATLLGLWGLVRKTLARTRVARLRGYDAAHFSFNAGAGACRGCRGRGSIRHRSTLLADERLPCPQCSGRRFDEATLEVTFKGHTAADLLAMTIAEAADLFENIAKLHHPLSEAVSFGLGPLALGQPADTLSGGELQRLRLLRVLARRQVVSTLFLLDEPTSGLHRGEVDRLAQLLHRLLEAGHTVVVIEHHLRLLAACTTVLELGPVGGPGGGRLLFQGPPEELRTQATPTGRAMASR